MEIFFNLVWIALATVMVWQWKRCARQEGAGRWTQVAAMAMLVLLLFPVISVSDDLRVAQNLTEDEFSVRRSLSAASDHPLDCVAAALPLDLFAGLPFGLLGRVAPLRRSAFVVGVPALSSIQNRPPPTV